MFPKIIKGQRFWTFFNVITLLKSHFLRQENGIRYIDETATSGAVEDAFRAELDGPGKLLGYRGMMRKLRIQYDLKDP